MADNIDNSQVKTQCQVRDIQSLLDAGKEESTNLDYKRDFKFWKYQSFIVVQSQQMGEFFADG